MDFLMEYVLEPPGSHMLLILLIAYAVVLIYPPWATRFNQRRAWRAFVAAKGRRFSGTAGDGRDPFTRFPGIEWWVTPNHVISMHQESG